MNRAQQSFHEEAALEDAIRASENLLKPELGETKATGKITCALFSNTRAVGAASDP